MTLKCYRCSDLPCACTDGITLFHGDCREVAPSIDFNFDMVFANPPYGETQLEWDTWPIGWIQSIAPFCKPESSLWCFGSVRMLLENILDFSGWQFVQEVVWEKHNGSEFNVGRFQRVHELLFHFVPPRSVEASIYETPRSNIDATPRVVRKKAWSQHRHRATSETTYRSTDGAPRMIRSVQHVRSCHGHTMHHTEKPAGILQRIIEYSLSPSGSMLVPFAGLGAELLVAKHMKRRAVGIEVNESYCAIAANRLRQRVSEFWEAL
jgi:site-specific DNA-methyltransferase (adenine-specific)